MRESRYLPAVTNDDARLDKKSTDACNSELIDTRSSKYNFIIDSHSYIYGPQIVFIYYMMVVNLLLLSIAR